MIEVELPDGSIAEFPDNTPDDVINGVLQQYATPQPQQKVVDPWDQVGPTGVPGGTQPAQTPQQPMGIMDTLGDVAASGASGIARGTADLIGLPGTIGDAMQNGVTWALGLPTLPASPLSGASLRGAASAVTGGATDYQPQTTPGRYAATTGEFIPGAVAFGGASVPSLLANAVAPGIASEGAGKLTEGTYLEPYARVAGALVGGGIGNAAANRMSARPSVPTAAEIKQSAGYSDITPVMKEARIGKSEYQRIVDGLRASADDFGMTTQQKGEFNGILNDFAKRGAKDGGSMYDLEILRRSLANAGQDVTKPANQALSGRLVDHLDEAVDGISGAGQVASSGQTIDQVKDALNLARETYRTGRKAELVEDAIAKAQNQATGVENGLRIQFRRLLDNKKLSKNFSDIEKSAMQDVVKGDFTTNAMRFVGTFGVPIDQGRSFLGPVAGLLGGGAAGGGMTLGGISSAVALPAVGTAAKYGASKATQNAASIAEALVKAGPNAGPIYQQALQAADTATREAVLRNLLQSSSAYQSGSRQ